MQKNTTTAEQTQLFAKDFATMLKTGDVLCLYGNLGAGKTTFVQGLIKGLGISKRIISPTFVIMRSYKMNNIKMFYHVDLYRLESGKGIEETGLLDILKDGKSIVAIEWPEKMENLLPKKRWDIHLNYINEDERNIIIEKIQ